MSLKDVVSLQKDVGHLQQDVSALQVEMALVQQALTEYLQTDHSLHVLVEQLLAQGLKLDVAAIFPQPQ